MKVMLLAAGEGTRFRPHTSRLPKPALPFLNIPLAYHSLSVLDDFGALDVVVNTYHLPDEIVKIFSDIKKSLQSLEFSHEKKLMGSGGGLWMAREHFVNDDQLVLMNADEIILPTEPFQLKKACALHQESEAIATIVVMEHSEVGSKFGGVWVDEDDNVLGFGKERHPKAIQGHHFVGVQFLSKKIFKYLPDGESNILYDAVTAALNAGEKVQIFKIKTHWFETGNLKDYLLATEKCLQLVSEGECSHLEFLLKKFAPKSSLQDGASGLFLCDSSAQFKVKNLSGFAVIGRKAKINDKTKIKNCVVADEVQILAGDQLSSELLL